MRSKDVHPNGQRRERQGCVRSIVGLYVNSINIEPLCGPRKVTLPAHASAQARSGAN